jgi:hypothetical protein
MAKYSITNGSTSGAGTQQNLTTVYQSAVIGLTGANANPRRFKIYDLLIGTNGTPADNFIEWDISRVTLASTTTSATPQPLDLADAASVTTTTVNSSQFGTITANSQVFYLGANQRASYRWVASPGGELVSPATSSAGFQLRARSGAYTGTVTATIYYDEQ